MQQDFIPSKTDSRLFPGPLAIERALILQPAPIPSHAADALAVEVRDGIIRAGARGVDSVLLDTLVEASLFDIEGGELAAVEDAPEGVAEDGAEEPADEHGGEDGDARGDDGVGGDELEEVVGELGVGGEEGHGAGGGGEGGDDGGGEGVAPSGGAEGEEGVPV